MISEQIALILTYLEALGHPRQFRNPKAGDGASFPVTYRYALRFRELPCPPHCIPIGPILAPVLAMMREAVCVVPLAKLLSNGSHAEAVESFVEGWLSDEEIDGGGLLSD